MLNTNILASSSEGNCTHIFTEDASILIDAGISFKKVSELSGTENFDAIFISHEHSDHVKGLGPLGRKTGAMIYIHELVYKKLHEKLDKCNVTVWNPGDEITIGDLKINNFSTRHDSIYSYGFTVEQKGGKKLGYLTDTGSWTKLMGNHLKGCNGYILEADYDHKLLMAYDDYDDYLKERIASNWGHLSNEQTMDLLEYLSPDSPEFVIFAHLSPRTNTHELVLEAAKKKFPDWEDSVFSIAPPGKIVEL